MRRIRMALLAIAVPLAALLLMGQAQQQFEWLVAKRLTVHNTTALNDTTIASDLTVADDATVGGNLTVTGVIAAASYITGEADVILPAAVTVVTDATIGDDLTVGDDALISGDLAVAGATTLTGTTTLVGATDMQGNVADSGGALTVADNVVIDGAADVIQLTVQGHSTQSSNPNLFVVENSGGTDQFTVNATGTAAVTGDLTVGDDLTVTDDASANDLTVADFVNITAQAVITLTDGAVLTATGSIQPILAEAAIGIDGGTNIAHVTDRLTLINIGTETITLTETTGLISAGNIALGAGDASTIIWVNGGWVEIGRSNN